MVNSYHYILSSNCISMIFFFTFAHFNYEWFGTNSLIASKTLYSNTNLTVYFNLIVFSGSCHQTKRKKDVFLILITECNNSFSHLTNYNAIKTTIALKGLALFRLDPDHREKQSP